jgi:hypothetical protein
MNAEASRKRQSRISGHANAHLSGNGNRSANDGTIRRTKNLVEAIRAHRSSGSEANLVVDRFNRLTERERQDVINFLRSL